MMPSASKKMQNLAFGFLMSFVMQSILAGVSAVNNVGLTEVVNFYSAWRAGLLAALPIGILLALVMGLFIKPKMDKLIIR